MDCHLMVSQPEKVCDTYIFFELTNILHQWVDEIADAGGSLITFHIEATCRSPLSALGPICLLFSFQWILSPLYTPSTQEI